jgi:hypothetical protein
MMCWYPTTKLYGIISQQTIIISILQCDHLSSHKLEIM